MYATSESGFIIKINVMSKPLYHYMHTLGSQCVENSIQLVGDLSQYEGTPVICLGGDWGKVCGASTHAAATAVVACRQLGFSAEGKLMTVVFIPSNYMCIDLP